MKKIVLLAAAVVIAAAFAGAESMALTVDDAVDVALRQNLGLQQSAIELRTKERAKNTAWNAFLPSMAASAGIDSKHSGVYTDSSTSSSGFTDPGNFGFSGALNFSLPINAGLGAGIKSLKSDYDSGLISYEEASKQLERDVRKQFYSLLANKENIGIQEANLELAQRRLGQARSNFENGLAPELEVLSAEVTVANLQPVVDRVISGYESLLLKFKFDLGIPRDMEIELTGNLDTDLYNLDSEELIQKYMANRLDIRGLDQQIRTLELQKNGINMNMNTPTLNLGYTWAIAADNSDSTSIPWAVTPAVPAPDTVYGTMSTSMDPWSTWAGFGTLSIGLQWKFDGIIPGSSTNVTLKEMQDGIDTLTLARQMAYEGAGLEITNYVNNLATYRKTIEANTSSVDLARRNYELTEEAYQVGTRELLDVETQQQAFLEAAQQLLLNKYEYIAGLLDLEYALNAPMEEFLN